MLTQDPSHPTGIADSSEKGGSAVSRARLRKAHAALQMRRAAATWDEIAEVLGFPTGQHAQSAVERALENDLANPESQQFMRHLASTRLDRLLRGVWEKAIDPENPEHLLATTKARELIRDYRQLHGLDAPVEMVVTSPSAAELDRWVAEVVKAKAPQLEEANIFEGEVVGDVSEFVHTVNPEVPDAPSSE